MREKKNKKRKREQEREEEGDERERERDLHERAKEWKIKEINEKERSKRRVNEIE